MRTEMRAPEPLTVARPGMLRALVMLVHITTLAVFIQAVLAGQWLVNSSVIKVHGYIGSLSWLLALAQVALVLLAGIPGRHRTALLGTTTLLALLMTAQIGMGYAGRTNTNVAAIHLPNGVLIFGLLATAISLVLRARRELLSE